MRRCIGGDLDGQSVELDGRAFNASTMNPELKSEYYLQLFMKDEEKHLFWIDTEISSSESTEKILNVLNGK